MRLLFVLGIVGYIANCVLDLIVGLLKVFKTSIAQCIGICLNEHLRIFPSTTQASGIDLNRGSIKV
jgi:hypothetical protein